MNRADVRSIVAGLLLAGAFAVLSPTIAWMVPPDLGIDWRLTYRPAALAVPRGADPYDPALSPSASFFAAPWGLLPLLPVALLPLELGRAVIMAMGLAAFALTAYRLGATALVMALFLLSPPVLHCILNANIEWLPLLGFVLPPSLGIFFVTIKPQLGFAVAVFWLWEAWRTGGITALARLTAPIGAAVVVTGALYGWWFLRAGNVLLYSADFNASLFPLSVPVGLVLIVTAFQRRRVEWAMGASPCLSPYVIFHSGSAALAALMRLPVQMAAAVGGLWLVTLAQLLRP